MMAAMIAHGDKPTLSLWVEATTDRATGCVAVAPADPLQITQQILEPCDLLLRRHLRPVAFAIASPMNFRTRALIAARALSLTPSHPT